MSFADPPTWISPARLNGVSSGQGERRRRCPARSAERRSTDELAYQVNRVCRTLSTPPAFEMLMIPPIARRQRHVLSGMAVEDPGAERRDDPEQRRSRSGTRTIVSRSL